VQGAAVLAPLTGGTWSSCLHYLLFETHSAVAKVTGALLQELDKIGILGSLECHHLVGVERPW